MENLRKSSENAQKRRHQYVCMIKKKHYTIARRYELILCSRGRNNISLARCAHRATRILIKFISFCHRGTSSMYKPVYILITKEYTDICSLSKLNY